MTHRESVPKAGMVAQWSGWCYRCGEPVTRGVSRIVFHRGNPLHVECASGQDDQ